MCIVCGSGPDRLLRAIVGHRAPARTRAAGPLLASAVAPPVTPPLDPRSLGTLAGPADIILRGGCILTMSETAPTADAIAVRAGRIKAVGDEAAVLAHRGRLTRIIDLHGKALLPGFVNAHWHMPYTLLCDWVDASGAGSSEAMLATLAANMPAVSPGEWIVVGVGAEPTGTMQALVERLTNVAPENPVLVTGGDGDIIAGNVLAAAAARPFPRHVSALLGQFAGRAAVSTRPIRARLAKLLAQTAAAGVTCLRICGLGTLTGAGDLDLMRDAISHAPPLRLRGALDSLLLADWNALHLQPGFGDDMFRVDTMSAWKSDPPDDRAAATWRKICAAGWGLTLHLPDNAHIQSALACFESLRASGVPLDQRCGIECRHPPAAEQAARLRRLGVSLGLAADGNRPDDDSPDCTALPVSLGMDVAAGPSQPLRMLADRPSPGKDLACITIGAARRCGAGDILGSLAPGKYADFVFLDRDPRTVTPSEFASLQCLSTWLNGQEVFRA